ncbi:unnamed protein product [Cladocopium goreaui]|uniref:Dynein heavy chain coiled coil stalk domain-containing protein n=1 Tax=Cladocopium goreaui TaxID=2562237 RepID=A0A9P1FWI5_9DINO|nr:unnamed protein product [Cladocopium goreaui]
MELENNKVALGTCEAAKTQVEAELTTSKASIQSLEEQLQNQKETSDKELETLKAASSSLQASKTALEAEHKEQKDLVASLEEQLEKQKQLTDAEAESKADVERKLQEAQASELALRNNLEAKMAIEPESKADVSTDVAERKSDSEKNQEKETLEKELEAVNAASSSLEASKAALEAELKEQKDLVASLEEKFQKQQELTDVAAESRAAMEKKLQEAEASETSIRSELEAAKTSASQQTAAMEAKLQEFEASHTALTSELQRSRAAEAASVELNGELMNQMQDADDRASSLTVELIAAKDSLRSCQNFKIALEGGLMDFKERLRRVLEPEEGDAFAGHSRRQSMASWCQRRQEFDPWLEVKEAVASLEKQMSKEAKDVALQDITAMKAELDERRGYVLSLEGQVEQQKQSIQAHQQTSAEFEAKLQEASASKVALTTQLEDALKACQDSKTDLEAGLRNIFERVVALVESHQVDSDPEQGVRIGSHSQVKACRVARSVVMLQSANVVGETWGARIAIPRRGIWRLVLSAEGRCWVLGWSKMVEVFGGLVPPLFLKVLADAFEQMQLSKESQKRALEGLTGLKSELEEKKNHVLSLQEQMQQQKELLDAHEEGAAEVQLKETLASKEALVAELEERKASAAVAAESQAELARKVAESANEVAALRQELATAEDALSSCQTSKREVEEAKSTIEARLQEAEASQASLTEELQEARATATASETSKTELSQKVSEANERMAALQIQVTTSEDSLSSCQSSKTALEAGLQNLRERVVTLVRSYQVDAEAEQGEGVPRRSICGDASICKRRRRDGEGFGGWCSRRKEEAVEVAEVAAQLEVLAETLAQMQRAEESQKRALEGLTGLKSELEEKKNHVLSLQEQMQQQKELLDAHEEGAAEVQLKETLASKEALVAELEERKASAAVAAESQAELARKVAESANEVAALRQELATAEDALSSCQTSKREVEEAKSTIEARLQEAEASQASLTEELQEARATATASETSKTELSQKVSEANERVAALQIQVTTSEDSLSSCQSSKTALEAGLQNLRERVVTLVRSYQVDAEAEQGEGVPRRSICGDASICKRRRRDGEGFGGWCSRRKEEAVEVAEVAAQLEVLAETLARMQRAEESQKRALEGLTGLKSELEEKKNHVLSLQEQMQQQKELLDAHEEGAAEVQLKETLASKEALVAELEERKASAAVAAESQAELARKVAESANEVAALRQELATAEDALSSCQTSKREVEEAKSTIEARLQEAEASQASLTEELQEARATATASETSKTELSQKVSEANERVAALQIQVTTSEDSLSSCQSSKTALEAGLQNLRERVVTLVRSYQVDAEAEQGEGVPRRSICGDASICKRRRRDGEGFGGWCSRRKEDAVEVAEVAAQLEVLAETLERMHAKAMALRASEIAPQLEVASAASAEVPERPQVTPFSPQTDAEDGAEGDER